MAAVAGARASLSLSSCCAATSRSSPGPRLLALPRPRWPHLSLARSQAAASRGRTRRRRFLVRAARMESTGVSVGFRAPEFELPEPLTGKLWTLDDFEGNPALLVMFICNHCPFVKHLKKDIAKLTSFYMEKGLGAVAISSNSIVTHPRMVQTVWLRMQNCSNILSPTYMMSLKKLPRLLKPSAHQSFTCPKKMDEGLSNFYTMDSLMIQDQATTCQ